MKVAQLVKHGNDPTCFLITEKEKPNPKHRQVLIKVQAFGLNYADVMARLGLYREAPPLPSVLGYDVVGIVESVGEGADQTLLGKQVVAVTEFGGYAEYVCTPEAAVAEIPFDMPLHSAAALATQYATAYYMAYQLVNINEGDHVFIHAAAGGVGLALIQLCKLKNCVLYGTVSNKTKEDIIRKLGVQHITNSSEQNVVEELKKLNNKLDLIFDSVGGKGVKAGMKALRGGGRLISYGGAQLAEGKGIWNLLRFTFSTGFYSPAVLLSQSKSILGVNMLKLMRAHPHALQSILSGIIELIKEKKIELPAGETFMIDDLYKAHAFLQSRKSIGKIVVKW